jgi:putative transposase
VGTKRYRYRAYPTGEQERALTRLFGCTRVVFNDAVRACSDAYLSNLPYPTTGELSKLLITQAKMTPEREWLAEVSSVALQQALQDADRAYRNFFSSIKGNRKGKRIGAPRFRSRHDAGQSARFTANAGFKVTETTHGVGHARLPKIGRVRFELSRPLPSVPSSVTVIRQADGRYYLSFVVQVPDPAPTPVPAPEMRPVAGVDLGLNHLAVIATSDGTFEKVENPRFLKKKLRKLARAQKELARRQKGSTNRGESKAKVATCHRKVREARLDHHHKLAGRIVRENQAVGLETLSITGLARTRMAKSVHDAGWGILIRLIEEKAATAGVTVVRADRAFPSTRLCSQCRIITGARALHVRTWTCDCGAVHDRDINAAFNLMHVAAGQAETVNARGGTISPALSVPARPGEAGTHRTDQDTRVPTA